MLPLRKKGEFSNCSLCLTAARLSTDLHIALIFLGENTASSSCQIKNKSQGMARRRCQGMLRYSPGNKGACTFLQGGGESLEGLKGVGGIGVGYGGGQQGLFQEEGVRAAT